ncbi:MAG TPA: GyrI-like domain-containing protein, partial [Aggregatilineales bacterium]|nr:GyrI-like domain-containing protein [Aggregatilineales bacterium]
VSRNLPQKGEIKASEIPAGKYASAIHTGPYDEVESSYTAIMEEINKRGLEPSGIVYEFYFNSPMEVPPQELKTQILFRLK